MAPSAERETREAVDRLKGQVWIKAKVKDRLVPIHPGKNKTLENLRKTFSPFKILVAHDFDEEQNL